MSEQEIERVEADAPQVEAADAPAPEPAKPQVEDVESAARRLGWRPETEWRGDKSGWVDAEAFMERARSLPSTVRKLEKQIEDDRREYAERLSRIEAANKAALEMQRQRLAAEKEAAVEVGDVQRWKRLEAEEKALQVEPPKPVKPVDDVPPESREWMSRNSWFGVDPVMTGAAREVASALAARGASVAEQLRAVDTMIAQDFAHRMKPKAPTHAAVDGGGLVAPRPKKAKGWDDMPEADRRQAMAFVNDGTMTKDEYAKAYWEQF